MATYVERVAVFGGSTTLALGTPDGKGWVQMLHDRYRELNGGEQISRNPRTFHELGFFGARAAQVAKSVEVESELRFALPQEEGGYDKNRRLAIVSIGTNDSWFRKDGTTVTPLDQYTDSIRHIASALITKSQVLYVGTFPCDENLCGSFWGSPALPDQARTRALYEDQAIEIFSEAGATVVPITRAAYASPDYMNSIQADGAHVGPIGERWVYERVVPHFDQLVNWGAGQA